ncbi:MAG: diadenylate cyclase CdaA [Clostridia bacterium]|nr:diadenylate cyclase CdaA [Clostridia bacterium]
MFFRSFNWITDILDILIVAFAVYGIFKLVRDSRAEQLLKGFILLGLAYGAAHLLGLTAIKYLLQVLFDNVLIILALIFQPELRRALEQVGHSGFSRLRVLGSGETESREYIETWKKAIAAVCTAAESLQRERMGALIVIERNTRLGEIARSGTELNADTTAELLGNIFFNKAPLHDGATILRDGKVYAAGCILPLSEDVTISRSLGTRHRAAVGMSENSDALCVVVSEETGTISLAKGGELTRDFTAETLRSTLENEIIWNNVRTEETKDNSLWARVRGWFVK